METVSFLSDAFTLFLHVPKKKGASSSRDGWYPGLITTNAYLITKQIRRRGSNSIFFIGIRCHAEQVIKI